jgi:RNHCP domain
LSRDQRTRPGRRGPDAFRCTNCRLDVPLRAPGTMHRNHCPNCLWSRHVDGSTPGDRAATCAAAMEPIAVSVRAQGEWALIHRCGGCGAVRVNRIAGDDNPLSLMQLAVRPLAAPPFPLEWLTRI